MVEYSGSRALYRPIRVARWEDASSTPPASRNAPSHAAVLYDIATAGALTHHSRFVVNATHSFTAKASLLYGISATPMLMNWWTVSHYLAQLDPGDLCHEFWLVANMALVVGASLSVEPCAACILADDRHDWCADHAMDVLADGVALYGLTCSRPPGSSSSWPVVPVNCALYILLTVLSRGMHVISLARALREIQPRGRTDVWLHLCSHAMLLLLWLAVALMPSAWGVLVAWTFVVCCESCTARHERT